jgi:hypothetical protein
MKISAADTIAAVATPPGEGALAVVRISGPRSLQIGDRIFRGRRPVSTAPGYTLHHGTIVDQAGHEVDEVLAAVFRAPRSYTGEDALEISCHGGLFVTNGVLNAALSAYVLAFDQKDNAPYPLYKGKLYIDRKTLAFVRADFMISPKGMDMAADELIRKTPRRVKVKPLIVRYVVNYTEQNNIWCLNYIREELSFKVHKKMTFFSRIYKTAAELLITQADSTDVHRFKMRDTVHSDDIFVEKVGAYDESFWGDYNFIKPDESLEEALKKVEIKMSALLEPKK